MENRWYFCPVGKWLEWLDMGMEEEVSEKEVRCRDCGLLYSDFPLHVVLPRSQWLEIYPEDGGVLCARCIVQRASKISGATVVYAIIEVAPVTDQTVNRQSNVIGQLQEEEASLRSELASLKAEVERVTKELGVMKTQTKGGSTMEPILSQTELLQEQAARDIAHKVGMQQISRGYQWEYLGTGEGMTKRERALFDLSVALHMELHKPKVSPNDVHFGSVRNPMTPTAKELVLKCRPGAECAEGVLGETPEQYDYTIEWFEVEHERYLVLSDSFATEPAAWLSALESLPAEEVVRARWSDFYFRSKGMLYIGHHMSLDSFRAPTDDEALELAKKSIINELKAGEKEGKDE